MKPIYTSQVTSSSIARSQTLVIASADIIVLRGKSSLDDTFDLSEDDGVSWRAVDVRESITIASRAPVHVRATNSPMVVEIERRFLSHVIGESGEKLPIVTAVTSPGGRIALSAGDRDLPWPQSPIGIAASSVFGMASGLAVNGSMHLTLRAPSEYSHVQLIILGNNCEGITAAAAPSAQFGAGPMAGMQPLDAANAAIAPTAFTFGTTDPNDLLAKGGLTSGAITNAAGSVGTYPAVAGIRQGFVATDWLALESLPRSDGGEYPLVMARWYAPFDTPTGNKTPGWRNNNVTLTGIETAEPELRQCYATTNTVAVTTLNKNNFGGDGGIPATNPHFAVATIRFILRKAPAVVLFNAGDSTSVGYAGGFGQIYGPARRARDMLISAGRLTTLHEAGLATDLSENFHWRAAKYIEISGMTHAVIMASSLNDPNTAGAQSAAHERVRRLISKCAVAGIVPIIVIPRRPAERVATNLEFASELRARGVPVVAQYELLCQPDMTTLRAEYNSGDNVHFSPAGNEVLASAITKFI